MSITAKEWKAMTKHYYKFGPSYFCYKCNATHYHASKIGKKHKKHETRRAKPDRFELRYGV